LANNSEFYKGIKVKKHNARVIPVIVVLFLISALVILFYAMQQYAVITKDNVALKLPWAEDGNTAIDSEGHEIKVFDTVDAALVIDSANYDEVSTQVSGNVQPIRAIYISYDEITDEKITEYAGRLSSGNALLFEMKPRSGLLMWNSANYYARVCGLYMGTYGTEALAQRIPELKAQGIWLAAQISCCVDNALPERTLEFALKTSYGLNYSDEKGTYLDPYNAGLRKYLVELIQELYDMGFDEVILADVVHPDVTDGETGLVYTAELSTTPGSINGVCGLAYAIAQEFSDREGVLSIYTDSARSLVRADEATGQSVPLFLKLYDRVYYNTDRYAYTYNLSDVQSSVTRGNAGDRFVPVVINYLPDNTSWVYIDRESED